MPPAKRHLGFIDLTGDDDNSNPPKRQTPTPTTSELSRAPYRSEAYSLPANPHNVAAFGTSQDDAQHRRPAAYTTQTVEPDAFDLTQDDDGPPSELYCTLECKIVGIRFYNGYACPGEIVLCQRQADNQYDSNAIRVDNVMGHQIGHLPRKLVEKLAPYIVGLLMRFFRTTSDRGDITLEAQLTGEKGMFECPARLGLYGPSDVRRRASIEASLKKDKLARATQLKKTKAEIDRKRIVGLHNGGSTAGFMPTATEADAQQATLSVEELARISEAVDMRQGDSDRFKALAMGEKELSRMPMGVQPPQLKSTLLPYQLQALYWLIEKEDPKLPERGSSDTVQLWRHQANGRYRNVATDYCPISPPVLLSGGILADDMGLGKTLEMISLILTHPDGRSEDGPTLIVAPVSVMSNWEQQIRRHVLPDHQPRVIVYHGQKKPPPGTKLTDYDVVITSYGKLTTLDPALLSADVEWRRLVLDEGHIIRNAKTKMALAACRVRAKSRWVLSGTPIINSVKDLHSIIKFLRITGGIEKLEIFTTVVTRKLGDGSGVGEALLQGIMRDLCLRRRKDMSFIDLKLPEKKEFIHRISFREEEKRKYDALLAEAKGALEQFNSATVAADKSRGRFTNVLERLLRLRQICNHWTLAKNRVDELMKLLSSDGDVVELTDKNRRLLQQALTLYIDQQEDCAICFDGTTSPVITHCKHVFCRSCITRAIELQHKCPMCRNPLDQSQLLEPEPESSSSPDAAAAAAADPFDPEMQSSKTEAMLQIVRATVQKPASKIIIFSQWTSFLNIIQTQLVASRIKCARIDGSMTTDSRDRAVDALDNDPDTRVLLASLAVCSVGLNLVSADTIILADSCVFHHLIAHDAHRPLSKQSTDKQDIGWAPAIEDQAIDRVHRLGQTRDTTVWRLVMEGTVEERVLDIQLEKRKLVDKAFQERRGAKEAKTTHVADVQRLLA
ncbi:SWI/SNF-related matrix-associated actin-dependent regulator of chromatin subfamily A3 [Geosmithia morbida]|uniref:SWI/SNF-related matrix-associated actin-dependent regulator of chromatin subfamily A3 n=1 Tax=Geosmithia morbida TaxID=1094350 RepID=A0A9P4Z520_9HYPO|nr:SWI/SNF-related matrix-associated actin-dependent regulator of chromatin subfamily A3 [Geosmithia morbida]KAF4126809.1 SWI/SNF-related matrix-associated actin-dependent regulator of chromatin subfamily A3 [Geosmithia morbida]